MHTFARPPVRDARLKRQAAARAFTLIELLTVISIIGILAAISLGVVRGVRERAALSQAKAELASLAQALEAYKLQYGDYPQTGPAQNQPDPALAAPSDTDGPGILFNALTGKRGPAGALIAGRSFVELSRYTLQNPTALPAEGNSTLQARNALLDPWGNRYLYYYKTGAPSGASQWKETPGYILLTVGPDAKSGITGVSTAGKITLTTGSEGADDIYANK